MSGYVFNIQRFSVHDGPGIRTTVFLKGCSLRCFWCHNPEGIRLKPENQFFVERCIACGACVAACPEGAQSLDGSGRVYRRDLCITCGRCLDVCYAEALVAAGRMTTADEVVTEVLRDRAFYEASGGGVTLSGGEPVLQRDFSAEILERCKAEGLHTAIETAGHCRWDDLVVLLQVTDLVMMDLKHLDSAKHRIATGVPNDLILANARRLAPMGIPLIFRVPVVPTVNDRDAEIAAIARFVQELEKVRTGAAERVNEWAAPITLELLSFHRLASDKYRSLGLDYRARELPTLSRERMKELTAIARACGATVVGNG